MCLFCSLKVEGRSDTQIQAGPLSEHSVPWAPSSKVLLGQPIDSCGALAHTWLPWGFNVLWMVDASLSSLGMLSLLLSLRAVHFATFGTPPPPPKLYWGPSRSGTNPVLGKPCFCPLPKKRRFFPWGNKGSAPQTPKNDENDKNGGCHSGIRHGLEKAGFVLAWNLAFVSVS